MKYLRYALANFALPGMVILFCLFCSFSLCSCSIEETASLEPFATEESSEPEETPNDEKEKIPMNEQTETDEDNLEAAVFLFCKALSEKEILLEFSLPVRVLELHFDPDPEAETIEDGNSVNLIFTKSFMPGQLLEADLLAEDENGNILEVQISFRSKNNRTPELQINELRTEYSKPRAEFIEFKILSDGNLGALRVFAAGNNKTPMIFEFEPVEVKEGEYVVLHLRTLEESCIDEYGDSLDESEGTDSSPTARDFWIPGSAKLLRKTDAVYVLDQDDRVLDAVMLADAPGPAWDKDYFAEAASFLFGQGAWKSLDDTFPNPVDAVNSSGIGSSITRSISRDEAAENTHTTSDWFITANSGATPGKPNIPKP